MKWVKNYERVQEIQQMLVWPPITELDSKAYIPEVSLRLCTLCYIFKIDCFMLSRSILTLLGHNRPCFSYDSGYVGERLKISMEF